MVETAGQGDAMRVAQAGAGDGVDGIAVYGGDGTVMQAVAGLAGHEIPVGLIPGGTGNLLAGNLRLPRNPIRAARVIAEGRLRAIDLGRVEQAEGTRYFAVACGSGIDAELMARTSGGAKRRWGVGAYVARALTMVRRMRSFPYRITVDGKVLELEATAVMVANCQEFIPPIISLAPGISLDDGVLDVVVINASGPLDATRLVWKMWRKVVDGEAIRHVRGQEIRVESVPHRPVQLDGEVGGETPFTASIQPRGLSVFVPADSR